MIEGDFHGEVGRRKLGFEGFLFRFDRRGFAGDLLARTRPGALLLLAENDDADGGDEDE
jgi:hypothetical protein